MWERSKPHAKEVDGNKSERIKGVTSQIITNELKIRKINKGRMKERQQKDQLWKQGGVRGEKTLLTFKETTRKGRE
jgi:hypothetical protein